LRNLGLTDRQIVRIFNSAAEEAAKIGAGVTDLRAGRPFRFSDYPKTRKMAERMLSKLRKGIETVVLSGIESEWTLANNKNNVLCDRVFGDNKYKLTKEQERRYYSNNDRAREAFLKRKTNGLNLSDRVWKYTGQFQEEIEAGLDLGIRSGLSAAEMARDLKQYLREPDRLFRRVRDADGKLALSKAAKLFHPGQGVYRSSYRNARRLAATETNMAYRTADYERWQQMDFVVGIKIQLSNNHTLNGVPFTDICDDLKGRYPKDFKFTGWHPLCRCFATPVLKTDEEMRQDNLRILQGEAPSSGSVNEVRDVPEKFKEWVKDNRDRIAAANSLPYFLRDNSTYIGNSVSLTNAAKQGIREAVAQDVTVRPIKPVSEPNKGFSIYKEYSNGGRIEVMDGYAGKSDHKDLRTIAGVWAMEGKVVQITTAVHYKDDMYGRVFGALKGTKYKRKCPDLIVGGAFYEYESFAPPFKKRKLANMISHGTKQSSRIIINNNKGSADRYIHRNILERLKDKNFKYDIDEVWLYEKGKVRRIF
jgi:hypothetical protein